MPTLPDYIAKATPNPASNRAPWYVNTAPSYAGIFLVDRILPIHRARYAGARRADAVVSPRSLSRD